MPRGDNSDGMFDGFTECYAWHVRPDDVLEVRFHVSRLGQSNRRKLVLRAQDAILRGDKGGSNAGGSVN